MYEGVQREKEVLVGKVAAVETEAKVVRDQLASGQESCATAVKVCAQSLSTHTCRALVAGCVLSVGE